MVGIKGLEISRVRMWAYPAKGVRPFPRGTLKWFENNIVREKVQGVLFKNSFLNFQILMGLCDLLCYFRIISHASLTLSGWSFIKNF